MKIIDLSHILENEMPVYPGDEAPVVQKVMTHEKDGAQVTRLGISTHTGTHLDTPRHFVANNSTTDKMELGKFYGKGVLIDCRKYGQGQLIPVEVISDYEQKLKAADFALIWTGWNQHWGTKRYFDHFPTLSVKAADFLIEMKLKGIGLDFPSIDTIDSTDYPNHNSVLGNGTLIIENLTQLNKLENKTFDFAAFPLKIKEGDGSPVRAVAMIEE